MLLPICCAVCSRPGSSPCPACTTAMRRAPPWAVPEGLAACHALLAYEGPARELVARIKYRSARASVAWLGQGMAALVATGPRRSRPVVTWAPTTAARRRARGFDHAELLARAVAAELGLRAVPTLRRVGAAAQTGRDRADRLHGPSFAPGGRGSVVAGAEVIVVDDVVTTGATLAAAARCLRARGASRVIGLAAARTPA